MGAAGRDFHDFNVYFRNNPEYEVVAFTATQIPGIGDRTYPPDLSGDRYPIGIPILPEEDLPKIIKEKNVEQVVLHTAICRTKRSCTKASIALGMRR